MIPEDLSLITYDYQTLTRSVTSNITSIVISGSEAGSTFGQPAH
jgi:DNA-binding LacI/PurR family transcriptional regulator